MRATRSSTSPLKRAPSTPILPPSPPKKSRAKHEVIGPAPTQTSNGTSSQASQLSGLDAETESVLLHPALTFKYEDAKAHLIGVDKRWKEVMDKLRCKPFEGEQKEAFNPFRSLTSSILGQQVSWLAARSITHKFCRVFYPDLPEKLAPPTSTAPSSGADSPFPTPAQICHLKDPVAKLRAAGLSGRKVEYVMELAERFHDGRLEAGKLWEMEDEEVRETLVAIRGIGIWTVQMFLIFSMKRPDVLPVGDLGIQKNLCRWYSSDPSVVPSIHPRKLTREATPEQSEIGEAENQTPASSQMTDIFATPQSSQSQIQSQTAYSTPASPEKIRKLEASGAVMLSSQVIDVGPDEGEPDGMGPSETSGGVDMVFPATSSNLTPTILKTRLNGKKLKGNIYLTPTEMEELTAPWAPYRSIACWYLWSIADGTGDP